MRWVVAALIATGCGRIGFDQTTGSSDGDAGGDGVGDGGGSACVQHMFNATETPVSSASPVLAWNGSALGLTWIEDPTGSITAMFRTMALDGTLQAPTTLTNLAMGEQGVDIDLDGASFRLALGTTFGGPKRQVYRSTDGDAPIAVTASGKDDIHPRIAVIAPGITAYAWTQGMGVGTWQAMMAVVDAGGTKIVNDVTVATNLSGPYTMDFTYTGSELAVFYSTSTTIEMVRVDTGGTPIGSPHVIANVSAGVNSVGTVWANDRHLVTWMDGTTVNIAYVTTAGTLLHPVATTPAGSSFAFYVSPAAGATSDVAIWGDVGTGTGYIVPVSRDGTIGPAQTIAGTSEIAAAWVGSAWAIAVPQGAAQLDIFVMMLCP